MTYLPHRRVLVGPRDFDNGAATDYCINFNGAANQVAAASATNPGGLPGWFYTATSLVATITGTGDFNASGDHTPTHILTNADLDTFITPQIFGGYDQFQRVADVLGYLPTELVVDTYAAFTVASANEATTFFGMTAASVTDTSAAGAAGGIRSGGTGTTFFLTSDNGSDAGANIDNGWHKWRIVYGTTNTEWYDDIATPGTLASRGTITTEADIWPTGYRMRSGTTNRIGVSWIHLFYR